MKSISECFAMVAAWMLILVASSLIARLIIGSLPLSAVLFIASVSFVWVFMPVALDIRDSLKKIEETTKNLGKE